MATALGKVRSYHIEGTQTGRDGTARFEGDVTAAGSARLRLTLGQQRVQAVVAGGRSYVRATARFWVEQGGLPPELARRVGDRWIKVPRGGSPLANVQQLTPKNIAYCATHEHGKLTNKGTREFAGQPVTVLAVVTGPTRPGKLDPRCAGAGGSTITASDIRLSDYDKPVTISPPADALDPASLGAATKTA